MPRRLPGCKRSLSNVWTGTGKAPRFEKPGHVVVAGGIGEPGPLRQDASLAAIQRTLVGVSAGAVDSLTTDWDSFIREMDRTGVPYYLTITNTYDRQGALEFARAVGERFEGVETIVMTEG